MERLNNNSDLLKFIYMTQYPSKKLIRSIGTSYDNTGRVIKKLIDNKILEETKINDINTLTLSKKSKRIIELECDINPEIDKLNRSRVKGEKNKIRQAKLAMSLEMINHLIPNYIDDLIKFENIYLKKQSAIFSPQTRRSKIEKIRAEIFQREQRSQSFKKCWFISTRELREIDDTNLKNIPSTRVQGILHTPVGEFAVYNHYKKRMKNYGNFEEVFKQAFEEFCDAPPVGAIHFASSYRVILDTFLKTSAKQESQYILSSLHYPKQFYVPLTYDGSRQLEIYTVPNFRQNIGKAMFPENDIGNAKNSIFDAYDKKTKTLSYLGFECEYNELYTILNNMSTIHLDGTVEIYCFSHQNFLFKNLFSKFDNVKIKTIPIEKVLAFIS